MRFNHTKVICSALYLLSVLLSACGGGGTASYTVGGSASGLSGSVVLQDNGGDNLTLSANGNFTFATPIASGSAYLATVLTQPIGQTCTVTVGTGTVSGNVTNMAVACTNNSYAVGGTVSGLTGSVVLQDNLGDNLTVSANGPFTFATQIVNGSTYSASVLIQPVGQTCLVSTGSGTVSANNVSNVAVVCSSNPYSVRGSVSGLTGSVVLQDNNGDNLTVAANGGFTFATQIVNGSTYSVTVFTQPTGLTCSVANGTGTISAAAITNVSVTCASNVYSIVISHASVPSVNVSVTYNIAMSVLVTDAAGSPAPLGTAVSLTAWPIKWSTGSNCTAGVDTATTGTFLNEDINENLILDAGEDGYRVNSLGAQTGGTVDGMLTPPAGVAGALPAFVYTDALGMATFNLTYSKSSAIWIMDRIRAQTIVYGSLAAGEVSFRLPALLGDISPACLLPPSPYSF